MRPSVAACIAGLLCHPSWAAVSPPLAKRDAQFAQGEPIDASGKGGPILGMPARRDCCVV